MAYPRANPNADFYTLPDVGYGPGQGPAIQQAPQAPSGGSSGLATAGAVASGAGGLLSAYNAWEAGNLAEKEYEQALKEYQAAKIRQEEIDAVNMQQMQLGNVFAGGEYANKLRQQDLRSSQSYQDIGR